MLDDFVSRFGKVELGPADHPNYGQVLYERHMSGALVKRYSLEANGWSIDATTGERVFRLDDDCRAYLPDGRQIKPSVQTPPPPPDDTAQRLFGARQPRKPTADDLFSDLRADRTKARSSQGSQASAAQRLYGH